ncbi:MAG: hypothetical protein IT566_16640 [Rhodospirillaceae bacterium]|nr:hypothetical protein [Rhodospirillaceae bacterium]
MPLLSVSQEREITVNAVRAADDALLRFVWTFPQGRAAFAKLRDARRRARAFNRKVKQTGVPAPVPVPLDEMSDEQLLAAIRALEDLERALKPVRRVEVSRG